MIVLNRRFSALALLVLLVISSALVVVAESASNDILVWQGQYFKGTEFQVGTYEFNFTVYDAKGGGRLLF